jgi:F-type H+-transporting ATPase subunit epsilon
VSLDVHIVTPEREVWVGEAEEVIAHGVDGDVGILTGHAPLLVQLDIAPLRIKLADGSWVLSVVDGGFLHVTSEGGASRVDVLASHAELADEIDLAAARFRREEAERALQNHETHVAEADAQAELRRAIARIDLVG